MNPLSKAVSINPYFKINDGEVEAFKALIPKFIASTQSEKNCFYYDYTINGNMVFCREAYADSEAVLVHLENVGAHLEESGKISSIDRIEVHGPAEELAKLKEPLSELPVEYYEHIAGAQF